MTGARIIFEFHDQQFKAALARLTLDPTRRGKLMSACAGGLLHATRDRFASSSSPAGVPWKALHPAYAAFRRPDRILIQKGNSSGLLGSLTSEVHGNTVIVGTNKVYGAIHQFGGVIKPKKGKALVFRLGGGRPVFAGKVTLPARPYLGFGAADQQELLDAIDVLLPGGR